MDHLTATLPSSSSRNTSPAASNYSESSVSMTKSGADKAKTGKRKGTRSVSTLTPSQLARKRANDREAQRAIRARTKEHIENLEREIEELRSQHSRDQTVRDLLGRNKALEEEVRRLRESLGIRVAGPGLPYPSSYPAPSSQPSSYGHSTPEYPMVSDLPPYSNVHDTTNVWPSSVPCSLPSTVSSPSSPAAPDDYASHCFPANTSSGILERSSMPPMAHSPAASCITNGDAGFDDVKSATSRVWMPSTDRHRAHLSNVPSSAAVECVPRVLLSVPGNDSAGQSSSAYWKVPVRTSDPCCRDDTLITGYIADCRRLTDIAGGRPHREVILGPNRPNMRPLLQANGRLLGSLGLHGPPTQTPAGYPLVDIATTIFDGNSLELPLERVGGFILFRALVAWLVQPTRDTYVGLREMLSPQSYQQTIPHPQWMDFILWPHLRCAIIERQAIYNTPEFRHVYCTNLRLKNWPVAITEAFTVDYSTGSIYAIDEFLEHVWDLRNWGMHDNFIRRYPELEACLAHGWSV
ncbi:hypothetical protein NUW58_g2311 [Xylaria curta]|uniref:Uncharacterized protein n=1 Tax=Xylaria curta TaxID=42375 RepID=A0ACC1PIP8_9PEZI|nr:hypothetical protein NUW58_g2311 [Xylaria curta]